MKIGRKLGGRARAAATPALERLLPGEDAEPTPQPARDSPVPLAGPQAVYARVLDGDSLWLAVTGVSEPVGLRSEGTGKVFQPENDAPPDDEFASLRWHLPTALPGDDAAVFEIVTADGTLVRGRPLTDQSPMCTPSSRDGRWQFAVRRRQGGALVLRRDLGEHSAELLRVRLTDDDAVVFTLADPGMGAVRLCLVDDEGAVAAQLPVTRDGTRLTGTVRAHDIPAGPGAQWLLALGSDTGSVPVLRHRNDNVMPGRSTVLPLLWTGEGDDRTRVRFHFQPGGRVRIHRPAPDAGDATGAQDDGGEP